MKDKSLYHYSRPWIGLAGGVAMLVAGAHLWFEFAHLEAEGGEIRMPSLVIAAYDVAGKWGVLALFSVLGFVIARPAVRQLRRSKPAGKTAGSTTRGA